MKRKTGISLMMALLMVVSIFTVVTPSVDAISESYIIVTKQVYDEEDGWVDETTAEMGEIVQFRINITYYNMTGEEHYAYKINATDMLPSCLEYVEDSAEPTITGKSSDGKTIWWDFGEEEQLPDGEILTITFEAEVVGYGENVNEGVVNAEELCTGEPLEDDSSATVNVPEPDPLVFEKKVWDPEKEEWVENLLEVRKDTPVRFQLKLTYYGDKTMKCLLVGDLLPEDCFEYADNVYIEIAGETIVEDDPRYPDIVVGEDATIELCGEEIDISELEEFIEYFAGYEGDIIFWDWRNVDFALHAGESVIIEFDANVTYYCECEVTNGAFALLWGCFVWDPCNYYMECDTANVTCCPPDPIFDKKVWDGNDWVEEANVFVGDIVRFKIELTYYGNHQLAIIKIVDNLPAAILKYADNADPEESDVSDDGSTIWWNLTEVLNDGETLTIEFDAEVIGSTGDCEDCGTNIATYTARECTTETEFTGEDEAKVKSEYKPPVNLEISVKRFGFGRVRASIKNVGDEDLSDVEWTITVEGSILKRINVTAGCIIETLVKGCKKTVSLPFRSILRKFGRITVTVTVTVGKETFTETAKGFVFGRIIIVRPLIRLFGR